MSRYLLEFSKQGYIKYTSHLDMQRLFKRSFKRLGIPIEYSKGYNPHPRMGFVVPLSLGYTACSEILEFNTTNPIDVDEVTKFMKGDMPLGLEIIRISPLDIKPKSLASIVVSAVYSVKLPIAYRFRHEEIESIVESYLNQDEIIAKKREKKTKKYVDKDIKNQIRWIKVEESNPGVKNDSNKIVLDMELDSGSNSSLSPEQVISSFTEFSKLYLPREEIEVERKYIIFDSCIPHTTGLHLK